MFVNKKRTVGVKFKVGEKVMVSQVALLTPEERERHLPKLRSRRVGPYTIKVMEGSNAAELDLPKSLRAHPVINVGYLKHYVEDKEFHPRDAVLQAPLFKSDDGEFYAVEAIVGHKVIDGRYV